MILFARKLSQRSLLPYWLLVAVLAVTFFILALRGLDLGFWGDVLAYEYHYQRFGIRGGMHWLVTEHWHKHLLAPFFSAAVHFLFPSQSAAWYAVALLAHFATAFMGLVFTDALLRQRRQWLSFAIALTFAFTSFDVEANFEFPTIAARNFALLFFLVSVWSYLKYLRTRRLARGWYSLSMMSYLISFMSYEVTTLLFFLFPLLAYIEDRSAGSIQQEKKAWLAKVVLEIALYPIFVAGYLYLLWVLFPEVNGLSLSLAWIIGQLANGIRLIFSPAAIWERIEPVLQPDGSVLTLVIGSAVFLALWYWLRRREAEEQIQEVNTATGTLAILGAAMVALNILSFAPTAWDDIRLLLPSVVGSTWLFLGGLAWLRHKVALPTAHPTIFAIVVAFSVATGTTRLFQVQGEYLNYQLTRTKVLAAIQRVLPSWSGDVKPYILVISDAHPNNDLRLHAGDINFPYMFDLMYDTYDIAADALIFDAPEASVPSPSVPSEQYIGPYIIVDEEGIYSPLRPSTPIDPQRLVIVYYDSETDTATIWDQIPPEIVEQANIVQRVPIEWKTNYSLLAQSSAFNPSNSRLTAP